MTQTTTVRLVPALAYAIDARAGTQRGSGHSAVVAQDLGRYYRLLELAATKAGDALTLRQALSLVGERRLPVATTFLPTTGRSSRSRAGRNSPVVWAPRRSRRPP